MKKTVDKNVFNSVKQLSEELAKAYRANQEVTEEMFNQLKELREMFKEMELPTIVKSIRLVYEHLEAYGTLDNLPYWEEEEIEIDEENSSFEYYLGLLANPTNKYNREEIKAINALLKEIADSEE